MRGKFNKIFATKSTTVSEARRQQKSARRKENISSTVIKRLRIGIRSRPGATFERRYFTMRLMKSLDAEMPLQ